MENKNRENENNERDALAIELNPFAEMVLDAIDPDPALRQDILHPQSLRPVSQAKCIQDFKARLEKAKQNGENVLVAGDYDCDGMMSTAIMYQGLRRYGINARYYIPDRLKEGYGLSEKTVRLAKEKGYSLIVTVDNGVSAKEALKLAKELGIEVIVTDHHLIQEEPECSLLVHPERMEEPFENLCGAGVAFECLRALGAEDDRSLIYAAIASISDCMKVAGETRSIIQEGLQTFYKEGEIHLEPFVRSRNINETDVSFQIAPRINSIGRLSDRANANTFIQYLDSNDLQDIARYAAQVNDLNETRKEMTQDAFARSLVQISPLSSILYVHDPSFHEGIIGLAAGQLSARTGKPAIVCTDNGDVLKCSMRAQSDFHCLDFLKQFDGYTALGGHAQAAGFSLPKDKEAEFEAFLKKEGPRFARNPVTEPTIPITPDQVTVENVRALDALRPFGTGFKLPRFEIDEPVIERTFDLSQGKHRKFALPGNVQAVNFNQTSMDAAAKPEEIEKFIGSLSVSFWNGRSKADFLVDEIVYDRER